LFGNALSGYPAKYTLVVVGMIKLQFGKMAAYLYLVFVASFPDVMMPAYKSSKWSAVFFVIYISLELFLFMNLVSTSILIVSGFFL
jgi:hypothetical protein